jgi:sigma-E factor negative regulatory protein RseA
MDAMDNMDKRELISALADGQLKGDAFARAVEAAGADAQARASWCAYHLVGEVLRTGRAAPCTAPEDFLSRLQQRLREEQPGPLPLAQPAVVAAPRAAANDWAWKLAAGVASVAAVAAVGWNVWGGGTAGGTAQPQLAVAPATAPVVVEATATTPLLRDPGLDRLLAAHRQLGGAGALGTSSGFLRNATFEAPSR